MAQKLSYAGITLPLATPQLEKEWLEKIHPHDLFKFFDPWNFDKPNTDALPTPSIPTPPKFRIGVLHWPSTGASRPAWFNAIVNTERLNQIRAVVGDPMTPQSLILNDGRYSKTITASMYMLPSLPLNQLGHTKSDLWLMTLTDQRFYWYFKRGVITDPSSWNELYGQLAALLGISISIDPVASAYGVPSSKWALYYGPTPVILDAVATTVGQKILVGLDGSVATTNAGTAATASDLYISLSDPVISGGYIAESDIARYVPASVRILFVDTSVSPPAAAPHVETENLFSLGIPAYGSASGLTGYYQTLFADTPYTGKNASSVTAYAVQAATDWYSWRLADVDIVWPLIEPYPPTGWEDTIEWTFQKREEGPFASTQIKRTQFSDMTSGDWFAGNVPEPVVPPNNGDCGDGCGWFAGMEINWCMNVSFLGAWGSCSCIDTSQSATLRFSSNRTWITQEWASGSSSWINKSLAYCSGAGPIKIWLDTVDGDQYNIAASWNDIPLVLDCCGDHTAVFEGGNLIAPFCTGAAPSACLPNTFKLLFECACCDSDGWSGPNQWYCVVDATQNCASGDKFCVYLIESDACRTDIKICSGPYASQSACQAICNPTPPSIACADPPATVTATLTTLSGDCSPAINGATWSMNLVPLSSPKEWDSPTDLDGKDEFSGIQVKLVCNGTNNFSLSSSGFSVCQFKSTGGTPFQFDNPGSVITTNHLQFTGLFGGGFCTDCGGVFIPIKIDITW